MSDGPFDNLETLRALIQTLSGIETITDPAQPRSFVSPTTNAQIFLDIHSTSQLGWDDFVRTFNVGTDKNDVMQHVIRPFVATIKCESFDSKVHAHDILETLRGRLGRPSSLKILRDGGLTINSSAATVDLPTTYDDRVISVAVLDLQMTGFGKDPDTTDDGNWIKTVELIPKPDLDDPP